MPFVTEKLWITLTGDESVVIANWPVDAGFRDTAAETDIGELQQFITEVRRFRSDQGLRPTQPVPAELQLTGSLARHEQAIRQLVRLDPAGGEFCATAVLPIGQATVSLDLSQAIDVEAERRRLDKDLAAAKKELDNTRKKLGNNNFLAKAPDDVIDGIRDRETKAQQDIQRIEGQLANLHSPRQT